MPRQRIMIAQCHGCGFDAEVVNKRFSGGPPILGDGQGQTPSAILEDGWRLLAPPQYIAAPVFGWWFVREVE